MVLRLESIIAMEMNVEGEGDVFSVETKEKPRQCQRSTQLKKAGSPSVPSALEQPVSCY